MDNTAKKIQEYTNATFDEIFNPIDAVIAKAKKELEPTMHAKLKANDIEMDCG